MTDSRSSTNESECKLALVLDQLNARIQAGDVHDLDAEVAKYPSLADELRTLLPAMQLMRDWAAGDVLSENSASPSAGLRETLPSSNPLGDFRILRELGRGGMGVVYEAQQLSLDRRVALKILPMAAFFDERQLRRFKHEANAAASLQHPNIVRVHGVGCERSVHYYAMDLIDGADLSAVIHDIHHEKLPITSRDAETGPSARLATERSSGRHDFYRSVARLGIQTAEALQYAHDEGIIHRDIKPANLLLDRRHQVHIADFGLARANANDNLTLTGDLVGTLRYMSPEQIEGDRAIDARTDIYSLGLTLYEVIAGKPAFDAKSKTTLLRDIATKSPLPLRKVDAQVPQDIATIIEKAIAKEAEERYATAREFAADLQAFLDSRAIRARRSTQLDRVRRFCRRNPALSLLLASAFLVVALLAVASTTAAVHLSREARRQRLGLYARDMIAAGELAEARKIAELQAKLVAWNPDPGEEDLRGIEWFHLWTYCSNPALIHAFDHEMPVNHVEFIGNDHIVTCTFSERAKLLSCGPDRLERAPILFEMPSTNLHGVTYDARLKQLFMGDQNGDVRAWDLRSPTSRSVLETWKVHADGGNTHDVRFTAVNDSGTYLAAGGGCWEQGFVRVWKREAQEPILSLKTDTHTCVAFSGKDLLVSHYRSGELARYDSITWQEKKGIQLDAFGAGAIKTDERGELCVVATYDHQAGVDSWRIELWRTSDWSRLWKLGLPAQPQAIYLSADGATLAWGDKQGTAWLADIDRDRESVQLRFHEKLHPLPILGISVSADRAKLATASVDGFANVWDISQLIDGKGPRIEYPDREYVAWDACFVGDSKQTVAVAIRGRGVYAWDTQTGEVSGKITDAAAAENFSFLAHARQSPVIVAAFGCWPAPDDVEAENRLVAWNTTTDETRELLVPAFGRSVTSTAISPDGRWFAACTHHRGLLILDLTTDERRFIDMPVKCLCFSADGRTLAVGGDEGIARLLSCPDFQPIDEVRLDERLIDSIDITRDSRFIVGVGFDRQLVLYDRNDDHVRRFAQHLSGFPTTVRFSPDGQRVLTASLDGMARLWITETGDEVMNWPIRPDAWPGCDFSSDGQAFVLSGVDLATVINAPQVDQLRRMSKSQLRTDACQAISRVEW